MLKSQKSEKKNEARLEKSLKEEFIIDPKTGTKITLEEAESGHWISHSNEFKPIPESELENLATDDEIQVELALNYLKESRLYLRKDLEEDDIYILDSTQILSKYDNWTFSNSFKFKNGFLFLPAPEIHGKTYFQEDYSESQLMFWVKIKNIKGHYYLREKSRFEKILDKFRPDDDLTLTNYESFTISKSQNLVILQNILSHFENQKGLEIEIMNENLFVKTLNLTNLEDIKRLENILKQLL